MTGHCHPRTLHLIDIENLLGGVDFSPELVERLWDAYCAAVGIGESDQVVVATSSRAAKVAWFALPQHGIRRLVRDGVDGADFALIESVDLAQVSGRYGELVIATGDHAFTELALAACAAGMSVRQVIGVGSPARELLNACPKRTWLPLHAADGFGSIPRHHRRVTAPAGLPAAGQLQYA